jgi:hypothetical protein
MKEEKRAVFIPLHNLICVGLKNELRFVQSLCMREEEELALVMFVFLISGARESFF